MTGMTRTPERSKMTRAKRHKLSTSASQPIERNKKRGIGLKSDPAST
jgi:hypothetical protein